MDKNLKTHLEDIFALDSNRFELLFSKERVEAFEGQQNYKEHLEFIQSIFPSLQVIEVLLRNKIDYFFKRAILHSDTELREEWLLDFYSFNFKPMLISDRIKKQIETLQDKIFLELKSIEGRLKYKAILGLSQRQSWVRFLNQSKNRKEIHTLLVSKLNLGFWVSLFAIHSYIQRAWRIKLDFAKNIFPNLYTFLSVPSSQERYRLFFDSCCHQQIEKIYENHQNTLNKIIILLSMIRIIRNRISHCEYLLKYNDSHSSIGVCFEKEFYYLRGSRKNIIEYLEVLLEDLRM